MLVKQTAQSRGITVRRWKKAEHDGTHLNTSTLKNEARG